jgi:hypothetical protein
VWDALVVVSSTGGLADVPPVEAVLAPYRTAAAVLWQRNFAWPGLVE